MKPALFPSCCTARVLIGMGKSATADYDATLASTKPLPDYELANEFISQMNAVRRSGDATIVLTLNSDQQQANRVLNKLKPFGWHASGWMSKNRHRETKLRLWYFRVDEFNPTDPRIQEVINKLKGNNE